MEEFQHKPAKKLTYKEKILKGILVQKNSRKPLAKFSQKKKKSLAAYAAKKKQDDEIQFCSVCKKEGTKETLDRHHTHGRGGENMLKYIYVCRSCHDWIHGNPKEAKAEGFLFF